MLPLARAFAGAGHDVLWATSADSCKHVGAAGIDARPAGLAGARLRERVVKTHEAAAAVSPPERAGFVFPRLFGEESTAPMLDDLLPLAQQWRPDLLIHEHAELASPIVGAVLGLPSVTHSYGGAIPAPFLVAAGSRIESVWAEHGQAIPPYAGCFNSPYLDICPRAVQSVDVSHIGRIEKLRPVAEIGDRPTVFPTYLEDDTRPLVYLTLGTVFNYASVMRRAMEALSALPIRLLVATGPGGDPADFHPVPPNVWVERWVHQAQVLEYSSVVASHAGSGTFLGALAMGLPQLCLPQDADQFRNSEGGRQCGAALVLTPDEADADSIAQAVGRLLSEKVFRLNAGRVSREIRAMPEPAAVAEKLVDLF